MPVTPRFCGSAAQLPSAFCDFFRYATALSTVACHWSAGVGCARGRGSSANAAANANERSEQTLPHGLISAS